MNTDFGRDDLSFGEWLREARADKGISMRALALQLDITPAYLSDIENDHRVPAEDVIQRLTTALGLNFDDAMIKARRFGRDAEEFIRQEPEVVRLLRRVTEAKLSPEQLREFSEQATKMNKDKPK